MKKEGIRSVPEAEHETLSATLASPLSTHRSRFRKTRFKQSNIPLIHPRPAHFVLPTLYYPDNLANDFIRPPCFNPELSGGAPDIVERAGAACIENAFYSTYNRTIYRSISGAL